MELSLTGIKISTCRVSCLSSLLSPTAFLHRYDSILGAVVTGIYLILPGMLTAVIFRS